MPSLTSSPSNHFPISFHSCHSNSCVLWAPPWFGNSVQEIFLPVWEVTLLAVISGIWEQGQVLSYCLCHFTTHDLGSNYLAGWLPRQDIAFMFIQYFEHEQSYKHWIIVGKCECWVCLMAVLAQCHSLRVLGTQWLAQGLLFQWAFPSAHRAYLCVPAFVKIRHNWTCFAYIPKK